MVVCSAPGCQTSAGCQCNRRVAAAARPDWDLENDALRREIERLSKELEQVKRERDYALSQSSYHD